MPRVVYAAAGALVCSTRQVRQFRDGVYAKPLGPRRPAVGQKLGVVS